MATSKYKAQIPFRTKGQTTCTHHKGRKLDLYCEECQVPVCIKWVSTVHKSHPLCDLSEITHQTEQNIQSFIDKTEKVDLVQIDQYITSTDRHLKDNASIFENFSQQLKIQTNNLKEDLDLLTTQTLYLYKQIEEDNTKLLQTYKQDLEMHSTQLKHQVQECKVALQRGSDIQIYDKGCETQFPVTLPVKPALSTASFSPNKNPQGHHEKLSGKS
ncbi:tripartite motif-containing protein 45-like [Mizuhopecten yessoensis]|uniref:tripartite motif-containing protein 45-like n=1 Tax=Mizuhopecten yessoensis TaxID=6573 RepID=UPI000B45E7F9|nr:tripartite motif-containing protein 45-like [Mizuhopecten yessoensis]